VGLIWQAAQIDQSEMAMDRQLKPSDGALEKIAKTVPGEFATFTIFLKSFLGDDFMLLILSILVAVAIPFYATNQSNITSRLQKALLVVNYFAGVLLLTQSTVEGKLHALFQTVEDTPGQVLKVTLAVVFILQFVLPLLIVPSASASGATTSQPNQPSPSVAATPQPIQTKGPGS
jgi:hypothetical protein